MQQVEVQNVIYEYFTTAELLSELESVAKQVETIASQIEKLIELHSQAKIKDNIYQELREDLSRKARFVMETKMLLSSAVVTRIRQVTATASRLRHRLESLEIRRSIGAVSEETYPKIKDELLSKAVEAEDAAMQMIRLKEMMDEAFKKIEQCLTESELPQSIELKTYFPAPVIDEPIKKKCPYCEAMNEANAATCKECGRSLVAIPENLVKQNGEEEAKVQSTPNVKAEQDKSEEGRSKEKPSDRVVYLSTSTCPRCGADNLANAMYCFRCKAKLVNP